MSLERAAASAQHEDAVSLSLVLLLVLLPLVVVGLLVVVLRKPVQRRWYAGTGIDQWSQKAGGLAWADRFALYRANNGGRAAPPRLAELAVERGEVMLQMVDRMQQPRSAWRRLRLCVLVVYALNVILSLVRVVGQGGPLAWSMLGLWVAGTLLYLVHPLILRRTQHRIRASVDLNRRAVLGGD